MRDIFRESKLIHLLELIKDANDYVLTDDSWTLDHLEQSGLILDTARNEVLKAKLNKCGIA